jgi:flagellar assembly factor FliW
MTNFDTHMTCGTTGRPCCRALLPAINCDDTYYLPTGLPGFERVKGLSVRCVPDVQPFFFLETVGHSPVYFACIDPFLVCPDYEPEISRSDLARLKLTNQVEAIFVALVDMRTDMGDLTANLRGPLALNRKHRLAKQVDCGHARYPLRFPVSHAFARPFADYRPASVKIDALSAGSACAACGALATA